MPRFAEIFQNTPVLLPVVHVVDQEQAIRNTEIALNEGCDGVFLISMAYMPYDKLLELHGAVKLEFPDFWVGVNFLDLPIKHVFSKLNESVDGVWTDRAEIVEDLEFQKKADEIQEEREKSGWNGLYFGGVAFKYQDEVRDPAKAARKAMPYMDVITTSGKATGKAPEVGKIKAMKSAIGSMPLAISSGITPENISNYLGITDCFLTASSLLVPDTDDFDPEKVRLWVEKAGRG